MSPKTLRAVLLLSSLILGAAGCRHLAEAPSTGSSATAAAAKSTPPGGAPLTYDDVERGLIGRWRLTTPVEEAGDFYPVRELVFGPKRVWVTPSFKDYGGRYFLEGADTIRLHHDPTNTDKVFLYQLAGDTLTLSDGKTTVLFGRVGIPTPSS